MLEEVACVSASRLANLSLLFNTATFREGLEGWIAFFGDV
jgi:hypothetical protein